MNDTQFYAFYSHLRYIHPSPFLKFFARAMFFIHKG